MNITSPRDFNTTQIPIFQSFSAQLVVTDIQVKVKLQLESKKIKLEILAKMYRQQEKRKPKRPINQSWRSCRSNKTPDDVSRK